MAAGASSSRPALRSTGRARSAPGSVTFMLEPGAKAPAFTLLDQDGGRVALTSLKGQTVVLYFYPKADTPGCTTQACGVRDASAQYAERDVVVLGVSPRTRWTAVKKFHDGQSLNFTLLADPDHKVCEKYGTWVEKSMYGNTLMGAARATFIIEREGRDFHVLYREGPAQAAREARVRGARRAAGRRLAAGGVTQDG